MAGITDSISKRYRAFVVRYVGPSASGRGSRVLIRDLRHNKRKSLEYDDSKGQSCDQACEYLESIGIKISALALCDFSLPEVTLLSEDFATGLR